MGLNVNSAKEEVGRDQLKTENLADWYKVYHGTTTRLSFAELQLYISLLNQYKITYWLHHMINWTSSHLLDTLAWCQTLSTYSWTPANK
jgi:hypothetical protein